MRFTLVFCIAAFQQPVWRPGTLVCTKKCMVQFSFLSGCAQIPAIAAVHVHYHRARTYFFIACKKYQQPLRKDSYCIWKGADVLLYHSFLFTQRYKYYL